MNFYRELFKLRDTAVEFSNKGAKCSRAWCNGSTVTRLNKLKHYNLAFKADLKWQLTFHRVEVQQTHTGKT